MIVLVIAREVHPEGRSYLYRLSTSSKYIDFSRFFFFVVFSHFLKSKTRQGLLAASRGDNTTEKTADRQEQQEAQRDEFYWFDTEITVFYARNFPFWSFFLEGNFWSAEKRDPYSLPAVFSYGRVFERKSVIGRKTERNFLPEWLNAMIFTDRETKIFPVRSFPIIGQFFYRKFMIGRKRRDISYPNFSCGSIFYNFW